MNKMMIAIAAAIALPAAAIAQAAAPGTVSPPAQNGHGVQSADCKDMHAAMSGSHSGHQMSGNSAQADHSKMDHSKMDHSKMAGSAHAGGAATAVGGSEACHHAAKPAQGAQPAGEHQQHQH